MAEDEPDREQLEAQMEAAVDAIREAVLQVQTGQQAPGPDTVQETALVAVG
jgi:hypothetical protein